MSDQVFLARQPIFDRRLEVVAYELLFRRGVEDAVTLTAASDRDEASAQVLDRSLNLFGLDSLTGGRQAWFNLTRRVLLDDLIALLEPSRLVVEIIETVRPDAEVVEACRALKSHGYSIALDDFRYRPELEPLIELADVLKIDFRDTEPAERRDLAARFRTASRRLLAEKVETREELEEALEQGYTYFQGFFFCRPEIVARRELPAFKLNYLRFLEELSRPELDFARIETAIKQEVSLSYRLLRFLNSASFGWSNEIRSIRHAVVLLGERDLRRWASVVVLMGLGEDKPAELLVTALVRARFCELAAREAPRCTEEADPFLLGMLSVVDALVDQPLEEVLGQLAICPAIAGALTGATTPLGLLHRLTLAFERADWERVSLLAARIGLEEEALPPAYRKALEWADEILRRV